MILCAGVFVIAGMVLILGCKQLSKQKRQILFAVFAASILGMGAGFLEQEEMTQEKNVLPRNLAGAGAYQEELRLDAGDVLRDYSYPITVPEQIRSEEEERKLIEAAKQEIKADFLGENSSFDAIDRQVHMKETYQEGAVEAEWEILPEAVLDKEGNMVAEDVPEDGVLVQISVKLICGETACDYEFPIRLLPIKRSQTEQILKEIADYLTAQEQDAGKSEIMLPEKAGDVELQWKRKKEYLPEKILLLGALCGCLIPFINRMEQQRAKKKRDEQLLLEYPDFISKLVLLMGAGMNLSGAWKKVAADYEKKRDKKDVKKRISGEEMLITCHEMEGGIGEGAAYERFGERCQVLGYRKLGNTLSRNLQKGNQGLLELLETQVDEAFEERKNIARKYGEEAGTKLLFPMIVMLAMIMIVLLIPALLSFQI